MDIKNLTNDQKNLLAICTMCVRAIDWPNVLNISVRAVPYGSEAWVFTLLRDGKEKDGWKVMITDYADVAERTVREMWQLSDGAKFLFIPEGQELRIHIDENAPFQNGKDDYEFF